MKPSELLSRLNGISTPFGGVSWTPPVADVAVARSVLVYLEDRRVLYNPYWVESPEHAASSIDGIRGFLTTQLTAGGIGDDLAATLRAMRAACRKFFDNAEIELTELQYRTGGRVDNVYFDNALGELRAVFGIHVAQLAARYGLDVPESLVVILPVSDDD